MIRDWDLWFYRIMEDAGTLSVWRMGRVAERLMWMIGRALMPSLEEATKALGVFMAAFNSTYKPSRRNRIRAWLAAQFDRLLAKE